MKPFEERFTAWVDGQLGATEQADFAQELARHPEASRDREEARQLGKLLRLHGAPPRLANADFFSLQLQQRIAAERPPAPESRSSTVPGFWSLARLTWAGAFCLLTAGVLFKVMIPAGAQRDRSPYFAQVVEAWPSDPSISATTVYNPEENVTVLWLDGLDYIPASNQLP